MPDFHYDPALPASASENGFLQTITLRDAGQTIGQIRWHVPADVPQGVIQLLDLVISEPHRRAGHGGQLLKAAIEQMTRYQRLNKQRFRRIWLSVAQKDQVKARAFLTQHGFHHTATITDLLKGQDALIYVRAFD